MVKMHSLLISDNEFFHEIECNGMASFMECMKWGLMGGLIKELDRSSALPITNAALGQAISNTIGLWTSGQNLGQGLALV